MWATIVSMLLAARPEVGPAVGCSDKWQELQVQRKQAFRESDFLRVLALVDREAAILERIPPGDRCLERADGGRASHCETIGVGFYVCSERMPQLGCADEYLLRRRNAGCHIDPAQAAGVYLDEAQYYRRRQDLPAALRAVNDAITSAEAQVAAAEPAVEADAWLDLATCAALRVDIAAQLHDIEAVRLGHAEVLELLDFAGSARPGAVADIRTMTAWGLLLVREAALPGAEGLAQAAEDMMLTALATFAQGEEEQLAKADNLRINLALAAVQNGAPGLAEAWLADIHVGQLTAEELLWHRFVTIRASLTRDSTLEIVGWQQELDALAAEGAVPMAAWFAAWARGLALDVSAQTGPALFAYAVAEASLETQVRARPAAQQAFLDGRAQRMFDAASRRRVGLMVEVGDPGETAEVARRARTRALRMSDSCGDGSWRGHDSRPDELRLLYFRASERPAIRTDSGSRWIGFAISDAGVRAVVLTLPELSADFYRLTEAELLPWSEALLGPFEAELAGAGSIVILASEGLHEVPFHALPWDGDVLLATVPVQYSLDIGDCDGPAPSSSGRVLVVRGEDPQFERESEAVAQQLAVRGTVEQLQPRSVAHLAPLEGPVTVAHFIAHGGARDGLLGSDDQLEFSRQFALTNRDVLSRRRAPELVVLSACQVSFRDAETLGGGTSLVHAFLLRGGRFVVAPVRNLDGEAAKDFAERFYEALGTADVAETPEAFRAAYLSCRDTCNPSAWPHLRALRVYSR